MTFLDTWRLIALVKPDRRLDAKRHGLEPLDLGGRRQRGEILASAGEQFLRLGKLHPADRLALIHMIALSVELELRPGPARLDDAPAVRGGLGIVDDQDGGGALARGLFEFVGPATVIRHRLAVEEAFLARCLPIGGR